MSPVPSGQAVLLYGRHSSDLQNPRSTSDQLAILRDAAHARGWRVAGEMADEAVTGAHLNRLGLREMLARAERGEAGRVLAEAMDRISRDQEGVAHVFKRLSYAGVVLETLSEGVISELHVGLIGTMNQLFLRELANKTRRGLIGRVKAGFSGGGQCYGYDPVDTGANGERGVLRVDEDEARIVRRIFREFIEGASPRTIARTLNAEGVPGPRGGEWSPSSIRGDRRVQDGVLHQELYVGVRVFNRRRFRRHLETGRRSSVLNAPELWVRAPAPELRLMADELWRAAQDRLGVLARGPASHGGRPMRLLSWLMTCGMCGSSMILTGGAYVCRRAREQKTCENRRTIAAHKVEARLLERLQASLRSPEGRYLATQAALRDPVAEEAGVHLRTSLERDLVEVDERRSRLRTLYVLGRIELTELQQRDSALQVKQSGLEARRRDLEAPGGDIASNFLVALQALVDDLPRVLEKADADKLRTEVRKLVGHVVFTPLPGRGKFEVQSFGSGPFA